MNTKTILTCSAVIIAFALVVAPLAISESAYAGDSIKQKIKQKQSNSQSSISVGSSNYFSGNNYNSQSQSNSGSNNAAQN